MKTVKGDLVRLAMQAQFDVIVHGCNIFHTMGSGIAAQIRRELPEAYEADLSTVYADERKLGHFSSAFHINEDECSGFAIVNAYTQGSFGKEGVHVNYDALERVMYDVKMQFDSYTDSQMNRKNFTPLRIGIPKIGAGLGGGDWNRIVDIINSMNFNNLTYVEYQP